MKLSRFPAALLALALLAAPAVAQQPAIGSAAAVWRDFVVNGVASSGAWNPRKADQRIWGGQVEGTLAALQAGQAGGSYAFDTLAHMSAFLTAPVNAQAFVYADATSANNGIYRNTGTPTAAVWTYVSALVYGPTPTLGMGVVTVTACNTAPSAAIAGTALAPLINLSLPACNYTGSTPLPTPTATARGGVLAASAAAHNFMTGVDTLGNPQFAQPAFADLSGQIAASQLVTPTGSALGGVKSSIAAAHQFATGLDTTGALTYAQPSAADLSDGVTGTGAVARASGAALSNPAISGGSVNNAPVGATTPSTGAFTTLSATTPMAVASGGSGASTAAGARVNFGVDTLCTNGDSAYAIASTCRQVETSAALTALRTWTLPAASSVNAGQSIDVLDAAGGVTGTNTLVLQRSGSDLINGASSQSISSAYGGARLVSNGVSAWSYNAVASGGGTVTSVTAGAGLSASGVGGSGGAVTSAGALTHVEPVNAQTGTTYTIASTDNAKLVNFANASAIAVSVPQATGSFAAGFAVDLQNIGVGLVTLTPTTSTINGAASLILPSGYGVRLVSDGTNWQIFGLNPLKGRVVLSTITASASASLSDLTSLTTLFANYEITFANIVPATNSVSCEIQAHSGGAYATTSYVATGAFGNSAGVGTTLPTTYIPCSYPSYAANAAPGISGFIRLSNPTQSTAPKMWVGQFAYKNAAGAAESLSVAGYWNSNGAIDGLQIIMSSGNITSGTIEIIGWN